MMARSFEISIYMPFSLQYGTIQRLADESLKENQQNMVENRNTF